MAIVIVDATATKRNPKTKRPAEEMVAQIDRPVADFSSAMQRSLSQIRREYVLTASRTCSAIAALPRQERHFCATSLRT